MNVLGLVEQLRDRLVVHSAKDDDHYRCPSSPPPSAAAASQNSHLERLPWSWVCANLLMLLERYPSGVTMAIILSELQNLWDETSAEWQYGISRRLETIDKIKSTKSLSPTSTLEVVISEVMKTPGTSTYILKLGDENSKRKIEWYLHQKFYPLVTENQMLTERRMLRLTGCRLVAKDMRILPTDLAVIVLNENDRSWIRTKFVDSIRTIAHNNDPFKPYHIFVKVQKITSQKAQELRHQMETRVSIRDSSYGSPSSSSTSSTAPFEATFTLWDDKAKLATLFKEGDYLGISDPAIPLMPGRWADKRLLEYGPQTIIYVLPVAQALDLVSSSAASPHGSLPPTPSQFRVPKDEQGNRDLTHFPEPIAFRDLRANMVNISLFGRIEAMRENRPTESPHHDRFYITIQSVEASEQGFNDTGYSQEICVWDSFGYECSRFRVGQLVFFENLITSPSKPNRQFGVHGYKEKSARVHNVSTLPGLLMSPDLYTTVLLKDASKVKNFICRAAVVAWTTYSTNSRCMRKITARDDKQIECEFCNCRFPNATPGWEFAYEICWKIQDATGELRVRATPQVHQMILQMPPSEFVNLEKGLQQAKLDSTIGREFVFSVSQMGQGYPRIDQVAPTNVVAEALKLLGACASDKKRDAQSMMNV